MKLYIKRAGALVLLLTLATVVMLMLNPVVGVHRIYAQGQNAVAVPGYFNSATNAVTNAAIGSALAVTNPASNFVLLVQGGPVYCPNLSTEQIVGQSTLTLSASNTYQIEWNCFSEQLYAKTAVVLPGGTPSPNQPGIPGTFLAPIAGVEIPIATIVCNATACGNGGNGTITDVRPVGSFPGSGTPLNTSTFTNLPTTNVTDGTIIMCTACTQPTAGSATCTSGAANVIAARVAGTWRCY